MPVHVNLSTPLEQAVTEANSLPATTNGSGEPLEDIGVNHLGEFGEKVEAIVERILHDREHVQTRTANYVAASNVVVEQLRALARAHWEVTNDHIKRLTELEEGQSSLLSAFNRKPKKE